MEIRRIKITCEFILLLQVVECQGYKKNRWLVFLTFHSQNLIVLSPSSTLLKALKNFLEVGEKTDFGEKRKN